MQNAETDLERMPINFSLLHSAFNLQVGRGSGSHTHLKKFMRLLSVLWSSFPQ